MTIIILIKKIQFVSICQYYIIEHKYSNYLTFVVRKTLYSGALYIFFANKSAKIVGKRIFGRYQRKFAKEAFRSVIG